MFADVSMSSLARFSCLDRQQGSFAAKQILCLPGQRLKKKKKSKQKPKPPRNTQKPPTFRALPGSESWQGTSASCAVPNVVCRHSLALEGAAGPSWAGRVPVLAMSSDSVLSWNANYITKVFQLDFKGWMRYSNVLEGWFSPWGKAEWEGSFFEKKKNFLLIKQHFSCKNLA